MVASILFVLALFALAVAWVVRGGGDLVAYRRALRVSVVLAVIAAAMGIAGAVRWSDCIQVAGTSNYIRASGHDPNGNTISERCARPGVLGIRDPWRRG
jgi:hypothetical protein